MAHISPRAPNGFTLIEIVIMLAIGGLLVSGLIKGQELIASARVHTLITQQENVSAAYLGFRDRFRALPGDYGQASIYIAGVAAGANGNNNGLITAAGIAGATTDEHIAAWEHLTKAGFLQGSYTYAAAPATTDSVPISVYGRLLQLTYDNAYGAGTSAMRHNFKTGNFIPSVILAAVDRKIDDGIATSGMFQFSEYDGGGAGSSPTGSGTCYASSGTAVWLTTTPAENCGGASLF